MSKNFFIHHVHTFTCLVPDFRWPISGESNPSLFQDPSPIRLFYHPIASIPVSRPLHDPFPDLATNYVLNLLSCYFYVFPDAFGSLFILPSQILAAILFCLFRIEVENKGVEPLTSRMQI